MSGQMDVRLGRWGLDKWVGRWMGGEIDGWRDR
jgi:hypothetical protein